MTIEIKHTPPRQPGRLSPIAEKLFLLAGELEDFANEATESLCFEDYDNLNWWEAKLRAYGNLLETSDPGTFLGEELREAEEFLDWMQQRTGIIPE